MSQVCYPRGIDKSTGRLILPDAMDARLFTPLPDTHRRRIADDYVAWARRRDGEPDVRTRRLAGREAFFRDWDARAKPEWTGERIDPERFRRLHSGAEPCRDVSPFVYWLVQVSRANEGEAWGVDYLLSRGGFDGLGGKDGRLHPRDFADLEEVYHTEVMHRVCRLFGVDFELRVPPATVRQSVKLMSVLPQQASYMLLLAGELMGTVAFGMMAERGDRLLADHPVHQRLVRDLFDEIMVDEIGHVTFLLGSMRGWQLATIRGLAKAYMGLGRLSYLRESHRDTKTAFARIDDYSLAQFPERVLRRAFVPAPYWPGEVGPPPELAA